MRKVRDAGRVRLGLRSTHDIRSIVRRRVRWVAASLLLVVAAVLLAPVGLVIGGALAGELTIEATSVAADTVSDTVAATAAEFRVDESGAATYSIPIYGVRGFLRLGEEQISPNPSLKKRGIYLPSKNSSGSSTRARHARSLCSAPSKRRVTQWRPGV
jgi:hypothetical protein